MSDSVDIKPAELTALLAIVVYERKIDGQTVTKKVSVNGQEIIFIADMLDAANQMVSDWLETLPPVFFTKSGGLISDIKIGEGFSGWSNEAMAVGLIGLGLALELVEQLDESPESPGYYHYQVRL